MEIPDMKVLRHFAGLFNSGKFFESHEILENAWKGDTSTFREMYQGLIFVSGSFHHANNNNFKSALQFMREGKNLLYQYQGSDIMDMESLIARLDKAHDNLKEAYRGKGVFNKKLIPKIRLKV